MAENGFTKDHVGVVSALWTVTPTWSVEAKYNHNEDNNSIEPVLNLGYQPAFNPTAPHLVGNFTTSITGGTNFVFPPAGDVSQIIGASPNGINNQDYIRDEIRLTSSHIGNLFGATHDLRVGATYSQNREELLRVGNGWGSIIATVSAANCATPTGPSPGNLCYRARFNPEQPEQISDAETWGIFVQDQMTWNKLTLNLGVLANRDEFIPNDGGRFTILRGDYTIPNASIPTCEAAPDGAPACTYLDTVTFDFDDQIQPRVGVAYEIDSRVHDKFYANFARYSNMDNQSLLPLRRADSDRATRPPTSTARRAPCFGPSSATTRRASGCSRTSTRRRPTRSSAVTRGRSAPGGLPSCGACTARPTTSSRTSRESTARRRRASVTETSPDTGSTPLPRSRFVALTRTTGRSTSPTRSRGSKGNWDLDGTGVAVFYSSSYINDGPGLYVEDDFRNGILAGDRKHVGKIFTSYEFPTNTTVGAYLRYQSGRPWEARQFDPVNGVALMYAERSGSRRLGSWTNLDLQVTQRIPISPVDIMAGVRIGNVFDSQPVLAVDQVLYSNTSNTVANPNFGKPLQYASPRKFTLVAGVSF